MLDPRPALGAGHGCGGLRVSLRDRCMSADAGGNPVSLTSVVRVAEARAAYADHRTGFGSPGPICAGVGLCVRNWTGNRIPVPIPVEVVGRLCATTVFTDADLLGHTATQLPADGL